MADKTEIPGYREAECCGNCEFRTEENYSDMLSWDEWSWRSVCRKFGCEIPDAAICDCFRMKAE